VADVGQSPTDVWTIGEAQIDGENGSHLERLAEQNPDAAGREVHQDGPLSTIGGANGETHYAPLETQVAWVVALLRHGEGVGRQVWVGLELRHGGWVGMAGLVTSARDTRQADAMGDWSITRSIGDDYAPVNSAGGGGVAAAAGTTKEDSHLPNLEVLIPHSCVARKGSKGLATPRSNN
jgi:hypothetical protein